jgi:hypothetical protein
MARSAEHTGFEEWRVLNLNAERQRANLLSRVAYLSCNLIKALDDRHGPQQPPVH